MYSATADVSSIWKKEGEDDNLRNRESERTDLMLKPRSMSIVGLCLDILLIKKRLLKKGLESFSDKPGTH